VAAALAPSLFSWLLLAARAAGLMGAVLIAVGSAAVADPPALDAREPHGTDDDCVQLLPPSDFNLE
jgi:hypothetical protein